MVITEVIKELEKAKDKYGDLLVCYEGNRDYSSRYVEVTNMKKIQVLDHNWEYTSLNNDDDRDIDRHPFLEIS